MDARANKSKRGRKEKPYQLPNGQYVNGLRRRKNDGRWVVVATGKMFSEPDEQKAIKRFLEMSGDASHIEERQERNRRHNHIGIDWLEVGRQLRLRPAWVAEQTACPETEFYKSFRKPEKVPTPDEIAKVWDDHKKCGKESKSKVKRYWETFAAETGIKTIDEITPELAITYQDLVYSEGYSGKQQSHIFNAVRGILHFSKSRAIAVKTISEAKRA